MQKIILNVQEFLSSVKPMLTSLFSLFCYVTFPDQAYIPAACAVLAMMMLDIISKIYSLRRPHKSYLDAVKAGSINSRAFYDGTKKKLISFMYLMIMCGLSYRVAPVSKVTVLLGTFVYSIMFIRECESCVENLIDAGCDLGWVLAFLKRKKKEINKDVGGEKDDEN